MRLTRVAIDGDGVIELHPRLTLVRGLTADARQRLVDAIGGLPEHVTRGLSGWVELDSDRRELGSEVFEGLSIPADTKLVVRAGDLPGSDPALHRVSSRRADLGYERDRLLERLEAARSRVREATEECGRALRDWQVVHGGLPAFGTDGEVVLEPPEEDEADDAGVEEDPVDPRGPLLARIEEIDRALLPLGPVEPAVVRAALDAAAPADTADEDEAFDDPVRPDQDDLHNQFGRADERLMPSDPFAEPEPAGGQATEGNATVAFDDNPDPIVVAGRLRVAEARRALAAAQGSQRNLLARSEILEALEEAHAEVVEAHHRDRFGRTRHKVEAARTTEQRLLDQLGFPSYTAFMLSAGAIRAGDEPEELAAAQEALVAAEAELERIVEQRSSLAGADRGAGDGPGSEHGQPPDATSELRAALAEVGLVLEDVTTDDATLVALARSWLVEQESALGRRDALVVERAELEEQLAALPDPNKVEEPLSEVAALARAEAELLGAEAEVSGVTTRLEEIGDEIKDALAEESEESEDAEGAEDSEGARPGGQMSVEQRVDDVTWFLTTRLAALRAVGEFTLPILLDDPFVDFEPAEATGLLRSVEAFGGAVQIVLLTDDPALIDWTEALGMARAWVVAAGR